MTSVVLRLLAVTLLLAAPAALHAQRQVTMAADSGHAAGALHRMLLGNEYRDVWTIPITVPVLDLENFAGGLTAFQEGGNQTRTLRLRGADGKVYMFRSTRKFEPRNLPDDLSDTPAGSLIHDQSSAMHPTGHLLVSGLQLATGVLHPVPKLYVLPDHPRLGKFRMDFAGLMGQLEERPQDYDDEALNFAGAEKVQGAAKLLENLEESMKYQLDARAWLRARLIDFLVGDTDRGADQWEFARTEIGGRDVYRPIARDRDYAFMHSDGALIRLISTVYPKLVLYNEEFARLNSYIFMTREFDRSHLSELSWADWQNEITQLQGILTDRIIDDAIMRMPPEHRLLTGPHLAASLKARREQLLDYARQYYRVINEEAVVFGSDERERAEIDRHADGSVTVTIYREGEGGELAGTNGYHRPAWQRRFLPTETSEIRVHLDRGDDRAIVRGTASRTIDLRVMGGEGNDVLIDSTSAPGNETFTTFYDAHGHNTIVAGSHTRISRKPYTAVQPVEEDDDDEKRQPRVAQEERRGRFQDLMDVGTGWVESKTSAQWIRDWGQKNGIIPAVELKEGSGLIIGAGYDMTDFGFRRVPYETRFAVTGMISPTTGRLGAQLFWDRHPENSEWHYNVLVRGTQFESNRFFGWGNDSPDADVTGSLVVRDELTVHPALQYEIGDRSFLSFGPLARWMDPHPETGSVADTLAPLGSSSINQFGGRADLVFNTTDGSSLPARGFILQSGVLGFAGESGCDADAECTGTYAQVNARGVTFLSLGSPVLALRAGGTKLIGDAFPIQDAAFLGGHETLRGYRWNRFAGDAAAFGGAQLFVPLTRAVLFTRGDLGIHALADAGRVWYDGESDGGWHTGLGGGLWFRTLGQTLVGTYAQGEDGGRFYFQLGASF